MSSGAVGRRPHPRFEDSARPLPGGEALRALRKVINAEAPSGFLRGLFPGAFAMVADSRTTRLRRLPRMEQRLRDPVRYRAPWYRPTESLRRANRRCGAFLCMRSDHAPARA